jgi:hypothetical protein
MCTVTRCDFVAGSTVLVAGALLGGPITYLDPEEARRAEASLAGTLARPWELWKRKALR